jgi:KTSC domain
MAMRLLSHTSKSSNVRSATYDPDTQTLIVNFRGGSYAVTGVDEDTANEFERADSATQFYNTRIKGQYPISKV